MFTVEESNLIRIFANKSKDFALEGRKEVIGDIERTQPYLDASDMEELSNRVIGKHSWQDAFWINFVVSFAGFYGTQYNIVQEQRN